MASGEEAMAYSRDAVERAMKVQEVILRAIDGQLTWGQAADILGCSPRTIRRLRWRLQHVGYEGLLDRRRQRPSPKNSISSSFLGWVAFAATFVTEVLRSAARVALTRESETSRHSILRSLSFWPRVFAVK
jgi:hypothetical protein